MLVAALLRQYMDNQYVQWAFGGIRICVVALIIDTVWDMWQKGIRKGRDYAVFGAAVLLLWLFNLSAIAVVILAAAASFVPDWRWRRTKK